MPKQEVHKHAARVCIPARDPASTIRNTSQEKTPSSCKPSAPTPMWTAAMQNAHGVSNSAQNDKWGIQEQLTAERLQRIVQQDFKKPQNDLF